MNVTKLASVGSQVLITSGKNKGLSGIVRELHTRWDACEEVVLWRSAHIETPCGMVWANFKHLALMSGKVGY